MNIKATDNYVSKHGSLYGERKSIASMKTDKSNIRVISQDGQRQLCRELMEGVDECIKPKGKQYRTNVIKPKPISRPNTQGGFMNKRISRTNKSSINLQRNASISELTKQQQQNTSVAFFNNNPVRNKIIMK